MGKPCKYVGERECHEAADKDRKTGLCDAHSRKWFCSPEFKEAMMDDDVRGYMALGLQARAMMTVNRKYKARWLKRIEAETAG